MAIYGNLWPSISFDPGYARITESMAHPPGPSYTGNLIIDPSEYPNFPTNYCHAWIRKSDMPDAMRASHTEETDTYINFVYDDENVNANYPLGFITRGYNDWGPSSDDNQVSSVWRGYRGESGDPWWGGFYDTRFFNELDLGYTDCYFWDVYFQVFWWNDDGSSVGDYSHTRVNINQGGNQFWYNFLWGGSTITTTISELNTDISFTAADLEENGFVDLTSQLPENSGYNHMIGFISNYFIMGTNEWQQDNRGFKPLPTTIYNSQYWQAASDTTTVNYNSLRGARCGFKARNSYNNNTSPIWGGAPLALNGMIYSDDLNAMSNMDPTRFYRGSFMGGLHGSILKSDLSDVNNRVIAYVTDGNVFIVKQHADTSSFGPFTLFKLIKPSEMRWHLCLFPRFNLDTSYAGSGGYGYDTDKDVYPEYDENDRCTGNLLIGRAEILSKGRPWQLGSIEDTTFDPDEMPKPSDEDGPSPVDTEPKYSGDPTIGYVDRSIPLGGTIYYAMNSTNLATFIQRLWSQPKNFYNAIQIAGKQSTSIFDYITCLKYFPLNIDFSSGTISPVLLGTGAVFKETDGTTNYQLSVATNHYKNGVVGFWPLSSADYHWRENFLDYSPYTKISIYLPYAGTVELSPEQIASHTPINKTSILLSVAIDIPTGTLTYIVTNSANVVLAQKTVKVAIDLPLSGNNEADQAAAILRAQFSTYKQLLGAGTSVFSGAAQEGVAGAALAGAQLLPSLGEMYVQNSLASKQVPTEIGSFGGVMSNIANSQVPYLTIHRQKVSNPENYGHTTGYLVEGTYSVNVLKGFTKCKNVDVSGITQATDEEKAQIKQIMESGFYC